MTNYQRAFEVAFPGVDFSWRVEEDGSVIIDKWLSNDPRPTRQQINTAISNYENSIEHKTAVFNPDLFLGQIMATFEAGQFSNVALDTIGLNLHVLATQRAWGRMKTYLEFQKTGKQIANDSDIAIIKQLVLSQGINLDDY